MTDNKDTKIVPVFCRVVSGMIDADERIEYAARICYDSEPSKTVDGRTEFLRRLVRAGHLSPLRHANATFWINCSRACAQQLTRHVHAAYTMRSMRYTTTEREIVYERPSSETGNLAEQLMKRACNACFDEYDQMLINGVKRQDARGCLPLAAACQLYMTANFETCRHLIITRCLNKAAQLEIRRLTAQMLVALDSCQSHAIFGDLREEFNKLPERKELYAY
jgi:thymidylate synthase (FAD)